mgnify:CR=1 FL=1
MARVKLAYFASLAELTGVKEEEIEIEDGTTLADLLSEVLPSRHPGLRRALREAVSSGRYLVVVNGRSHNSLPGGLGYKLRDGDVISMFPPLGGG